MHRATNRNAADGRLPEPQVVEKLRLFKNGQIVAPAESPAEA